MDGNKRTLHFTMHELWATKYQENETVELHACLVSKGEKRNLTHPSHPDYLHTESVNVLLNVRQQVDS